MLDVDSATAYLLANGLMDRDAIIEGDLTIVSAARRNRNLRVDGPAGAGYLIKQADDPASGGHETLRREAAFYAFCQQEPAVAAAARLLPRLVHYDPNPPLLVLELVRGGRPLWEPFSATAEPSFPVAPARALGGALAAVHNAFRRPELTRDPRLSWLPRRLPWVMQAHKPDPDFLTTLSPASFQALKILQTQPRFGERLGGLRRLWQADTVIHNDVKSDNLLIVPPDRGEEPGHAHVRLVDWEMVQFGDPAWDVAGVLQDLVLLWINSMPLADDIVLEEMAARARHPWPAIQAALRAFWRGYEQGAGLAPAEADRLLPRAVSFSAARLIQTAYELAHPLSRLPAQSVLLLQVGANLLEDADEAQVQCYGIPQSSLA
ncbi:MAG TPA: phosphotransferase [Gemmataceae bacterium]|nr:phosphotransferase [Gemmataceae bacterium]